MKYPQCITHPVAHLQLERESVASWLNIFRLEIGASFFFNTTYHDFLRCIVIIFRLEIGASFFLIPRTTIFCLALWTSMVFRFVPQVPTTLRTSPPLLRPQHSRPSRHSLKHSSLTPSQTRPTNYTIARKYPFLRWLFRRRHLGRHLPVRILQSLRWVQTNFDF